MQRIPSRNMFFHGLLVLIPLTASQLMLDASQNSFLLYLPPLGFAFFLIVSYVVQPLIIGVLNVVALHRFYHYQGWQISFWLNGLFILLIFSTINLVIQTIMHVPFSALVAIAEIPLLAYPFGYLGKISNRDGQTKKGR